VAEERPLLGELRRFQLDGAEAVAPAAHVLLRPGVREAFSGTRVAHFAALPTLGDDVLDGLPVRVRPVTRGTGDDLRLTPADAVALAGWLAPAVLAGGGAAFGELGPEDIALADDGLVLFAPSGVPRVESVARPPVTRAPEGAATAEADLYGLGATLHRAVTGNWPGTPYRPPGAAGLDPAADALLTGLLSPDPVARRAAVADLVPVPFLAPLPEEPPKAPAVRTTSSVQTAPVSPAVPLPWAVTVPLKGLSEASLRLVAARSGVDTAAVRSAVTRGAWAVDAVGTEAEARRILARLEAVGVRGEVRVTRAPKVVQFVLLAVIAVVVGGIAGIWLPFLGLAAFLLYLAVANLWGMVRVAELRLMIQERDRAALPDTAPESRARAFRRRLAGAEISEIVLADLRDRLIPVEARIDELRAHEAELTGATGAELERRRDRVRAELAGVEQELAALDATLTGLLTDSPDATEAEAPEEADEDASAVARRMAERE
jgi:hypothetical protein